MKTLLGILILSAAALFISPALQAQTRVVNVPNMQQGQYIDFGGYNLTPQDSLQVSDSIAYIIPISHTNDISPYLTWYWDKIGSGTATVALSFLQGNDPANLFPVKSGTAQTTNYSKSYTLSASGWNEVDFARDTASVRGRYLKVYFITSSTASVKGKIFNRLKVSVK